MPARSWRLVGIAISFALLVVVIGRGAPLHSQAAAPASPAQLVNLTRLTLLGTTDLHGHIEPLDYYSNKPAQLGLAKIATLIRQVRAEQPNVLLLDSGDTIQGTPLAYYFARKDSSKPNPMILGMNALDYDAMAVGNHEFNFGLDALWKVKGEAHFPILAANIKQEYSSGVRHFEPFIVKKIAGVRVAIVGFVTPGIPRWEVPANYHGYEFEPMVDAAKRVIPEARKQADVVVVIAHSGLGPDPAASGATRAGDIPGENAVLALAEQVPGIDVILYGHTHLEMPEKFVNGVLLVQAKNWGGSLARVDLGLAGDAESGWKVRSKHSTVLHVTEAVTPDPEIVKLTAPYEEATQKYLDTPVATCAQELSGSFARFEDSPLVDLINKVQMEEGRADVSMATMFFTGTRIPAGRVTIREMASLYVYENSLYTVEMTGAQFRDALEHAASFFQPWPLPAGEKLSLPDYSADSAQGVSYVINLRQPVGHRIESLTYHGKPLDDNERLRVAINSYRYTGGGHYDVYKNLPIVYRSPQEVRELIIEYITRTGEIPTETDNHWRIEPREAVKALERAAVTPDYHSTSGEYRVAPWPAPSRAAAPVHRMEHAAASVPGK